jgi:hypothetical protein
VGRPDLADWKTKICLIIVPKQVEEKASKYLQCKCNANPNADGTNFSTTTHLSCLPQHPELGSYSKFAQVWHFTGQRVSLQRYERMRVSKTDPHPKNHHGYVRQRRRRLPPALPSGRHSCTPFCVTRSARWSLGFLSIFLFRSPPPFPLYLSP